MMPLRIISLPQATSAAILLILIVGCLRLFDPFSGDQALFLVGAEKLHTGGVLYRDFWDIKQPGIFAFFLGGGLLFGFTQFGLHAADLTWELAFSVVLVLGLRDALEDRRWSTFAPIAIVGAYFTGSSPWHLLQVEGLVGLPLFCSAWFAIAAIGRPQRRTLVVLSGVCAGIVVLFKLLLGGVVCAIVIAVGAAMFRRNERLAMVEFSGMWISGVLFAFAGFAGYVIHFDLVREIVTTFFVLPVTLNASAAHAPLSRLADSTLRFLLYFRGIIFLAVVGTVLVHDARTRPWRVASFVWLAAGAVAILLQDQSWWQYQFLLLLPPLGILATFGIAAVAGRVWTTGPRGVAWLALCGLAAYIAVPLPQAAVDAAQRIARERPFRSSRALMRYRSASSLEYAMAARDAAFLSHAGAGSREIYVFGNPLIYVLGRRGQAIALNGWALQLYTPHLWRRLDTQLRSVAPCYVFVLKEFAKGLIPKRSPPTAALIAAYYVPAQNTTDGTWFRCRSTEARPTLHPFNDQRRRAVVDRGAAETHLLELRAPRGAVGPRSAPAFGTNPEPLSYEL